MADGELRRTRHISLTVPDLGDAKQNAALDRAINDFIHRITSIAGKGGSHFQHLTEAPRVPVRMLRRRNTMKKFINAVDDVLTESLDGFAAAHSDIVTLGGGHKFIRRKALKPGKVALISGGGSGHEPLHGGLVGHGMLDAACPGQVFTSPTPDQMMEAAAEVNTGAGCLFIVKNYEGDVMNFDMAAEMSEGVMQVVTNDDVAVEDSLYTTGRRGVAGTLVVEKILGRRSRGRPGAQGAEGARRQGQSRHPLDGRSADLMHRPCCRQTEFRDRRRRDGIRRRHPRRAWPPPRKAAARRRHHRGDLRGDSRRPRAAAKGNALLFVNGFGGTPSMELYLMYNSARKTLEKHGVPSRARWSAPT